MIKPIKSNSTNATRLIAMARATEPLWVIFPQRKSWHLTVFADVRLFKWIKRAAFPFFTTAPLIGMQRDGPAIDKLHDVPSYDWLLCPAGSTGRSGPECQPRRTKHENQPGYILSKPQARPNNWDHFFRCGRRLYFIVYTPSLTKVLRRPVEIAADRLLFEQFFGIIW